MPQNDFSIKTLGTPKIASPIKLSTTTGDSIANYVKDTEHVFQDIIVDEEADLQMERLRKNLLEIAGPHEKIYFAPSQTHAAIVTCGGLCPGLNDVIRALVRSLWYRYSVKCITGIRYGYKGFNPEYGYEAVKLTPDFVDNIHTTGGTILGSSRGGSDTEIIVDAIQRMNINTLFAIGGDGTQKGALEISQETHKRGLNVSVIGIPKTIDNDLSFVQRSFGFETAVSKAVEAVSSAHVEANDAINGIGLVKVMGRESGFIAAGTALASNETNFVLIPEVPFDLNGENGLLRHIEKRLEFKNHAVILVAEGAGQNLMTVDEQTDASGNVVLGDIGQFLKSSIKQHFKNKNREINIKYIDPSYMIRSAPANPNDSLYCARLGALAVHAAMAGKTQMLIGLVNNVFVHIPLELATSRRKSVEPEGSLWRDVLEATRQPVIMKNK